MSKRRNIRLRKKLHLDEFVELGFEVKFICPHESVMHFLASLSAEALDHTNMAFRYEGNGRIYIFGLNDSLNEMDRNGIKIWFSAQSVISYYEVGPLVDSWHPPRNFRPSSLGRRRTLLLIKPTQI